MSLAAKLRTALDIGFHGGVALAFLACAVSIFAPERHGGADRIVVGLNWVAEAEHCGLFQAQAAGLYKRAGLDVEIVNGGPNVNLPLLVGAGRVDLAMGTSFTTLNMIANHVDGEMIAAYFQKDPQTLVFHGGQSFRDIADMRGRPIMVGNFARQEFWQFLKSKYGFTDDQLRPYDDNPAGFLADRSAIAQGYVTQDGMLLGSHMPDGLKSFWLADDGYDNYSQAIFGMRPWIDAHRQAVRRFVRATAQGYRDCLRGDPGIAMAAVLAMNPEHGEPLYRYKQKVIRDLGIVTGGDAKTLGIGAMTDARWKHFFGTMAAAGLFPGDLDYRRAYTLEFLDPANRVLP